MKITKLNLYGITLIGLVLISSCAKETSSSTGWEYNNYENGGFEKFDAREQETGPGLVMIEGGTFTMGRTEQDVMYDWNARAARVTVSSFYLDRTEVTNLHWLEYVYWMKRVYYKTYPHVYKKSLPDTLAWRTALGYREKYVTYYLRHPSYRDYPVVGVSWLQANDFCKWRTDRVNEAILVREGVIKWHFANTPDHENTDIGAYNDKKNFAKAQSSPENMFSTENYLNGSYMIETGELTDDSEKGVSVKGGYTLKTSTVKDKGLIDKDSKRKYPRDPYQLENFDPVMADADGGRLGSRPVKLEDGILLPNYRLPTEAEWEFAALGLIGNLDPNSENINDRRIYPWDGHYVRQDEQQFAGAIQANFVRGKGDMMGVAGNLNDGGDITVRVDDFWPNDYGLYHMAGNVSEWVMDVYRPMSSEVFEEFMPFRGNVYKTQLLVPDGLYDKPVKANSNLYDVHGMKEFVNEFARVMYLANTKNSLDLNKKYMSNYGQKKANSLDFEIKTNGDTVILSIDKTKLSKSKDPIKWDLSKMTGMTLDVASQKDADGDTVIKLLSLNPSIFNVKFSQGNITSEEKEVDTKGNLVNTTASKVQVTSRQDALKYKYNSPSQNYISNGGLTTNDKNQFAVLDDINAILDTAIYLENKGNSTKASHYLEVALFGSITISDLKILQLTDFRKDAPDETALEGGSILDTLDPTAGVMYSIFGAGNQYGKTDYNHYLGGKFNNYDQDPNITTWIMTLRNGLSEFVTETKGKQRWRNVTVEENAGRLNYRQDDYRDYLDGDLASSIYYNNSKRIDDINKGSRNPKQVMYQNEHENEDLEGNSINSSSSGWPTTLISDKSRVYKGGSWADRAYWLSPGNRRFLDEDKGSAMIGFRCAMDRVGSSRPNSKKGNK
jgi:gliding motility-associated lipoprotein GldJ